MVVYTEVNVQVRDLVQVVGVVADFAPRGITIREHSFYRETRGIRRGGGAKGSCDPRVAFCEAKVKR